VKFWDSSALVPLLMDEPSTKTLQQILSNDADVVVWMLTSVELLSALGRLRRQAAGLEDIVPGLRSSAIGMVERCACVTDVDGVRRRAERLVGVHPLTAADAMQLGAALVASGDRPETLEFVTLDKQLARSAQLDFAEADLNDDDELNDILWRAIRRTDPPVPTRSFFSRSR